MITKLQCSFIIIAVAFAGLLIGLSGCGKGGGKAGADPSLTAKLEAIRKAGQPVTPAELNAWYPEPAAGENAAPLYADAFAALAAEDAKSPSFLPKNQQALPLLHKAAAKTQCRYPIDLSEGSGVLLPHLAKVKTCAQLLAQEAAANAGKARMDLAAQSLVDGLRVARSLEQEPLLISQLVRMGAESSVQSGIEGVVCLKPFPDEQLVRIQKALHEGEDTIGPSLVRTFAAERCVVVGLFQMTPQAYEKLWTSAGTNCPFGPVAELERYRQIPAFNADFNLCLDYFSNCLAIAAMPFPGCLDAAGQWSPTASALLGDARAKGCRLSPMMLPELDTSLEKAANYVGQLRVALMALSVERYRLANSYALPDSLSQLAPKYLAAVPEDPYDGKPLRYKKLSPKGYVVYSIGRNRQDDGGTPRPPGAKADGPYDLTFLVRR